LFRNYSFKLIFMEKKILLLLILAFATFSCKKDVSSLDPSEEKITVQKKMNGPECPSCDILVPAPNVDQPSFGGDCNSGMGTWLSPDSYKSTYFTLTYQRNPTTNLLEILNVNHGSNLTGGSITIIPTGVSTNINNAANVITAIFSTQFCRNSVYHYNPDTQEWEFGKVCEPLFYNLHIDACSGVSTFNM